MLIGMGASRADAEDAAQEAMILAWQKWASIHKPSAWVSTTAARIFLKKKALRKKDQMVALEEAVAQSNDLETMMFDDGQQEVLRLLRALPNDQRCITALYYDGLSYDEIAEVTHKPIATVRSQLRHARIKLKKVVMSDSL